MYKRNRIGYTVFDEDYTRNHLYGISFKERTIKEAQLRLAMEEMSKAGIYFTPEMDKYNPPLVNMPKLLTDNINSHFDRMAKELHGDTFRALNSYSKKEYSDYPKPEEYILQAGWTKYVREGENWITTSVETPCDKTFVFDTETFVKGSRFSHPIIGSAISDKACYLWLHPSFVEPSIPYKPRLIPIGLNKVVITWNGPYDAQRTEERYTLDSTANIWVDAMAMHRLCFGIDSKQQTLQASLKKKPWIPKPPWILHKKGCGASLLEAYNFHMGTYHGKDAKDPRNLFVQAETMGEIAVATQACLEYAIQDVLWTHELFCKLWSIYQVRARAMSVWAAHFIIHDALLPVSPDWTQWVRDTEAKYQSDMDLMSQIVRDIADSTFESWKAGELNVLEDDFLKHLDWSYCGDTESPYYKIPKWYLERVHPTKTFNTNPKTATVTYLLRLRWEGKPIQYIKNKSKHDDGGWMYVNEDGELTKLDHKSGDESNVGSVFNSFYLQAFKTGVMTSDNPDTRKIMEIVDNNSYWVSVRKRSMEAHIQRVEDPLTGYPINLLAPMMGCHSTITGRSADKFANTFPSHLYGEKLARELKSLVVAPEGYHLVAFDFASQELGVGVAYSCNQVGLSGSSAYAHMLITGNKKEKTDMYSIEAAKVGVSRDDGKTVLLGAQYLAGLKTLTQKVFAKNPSRGLDTTRELVKKILSNFRGYSNFDTGRYEGGSASKAFNFMTQLVLSDDPCTPNLRVKMPPAIQPRWNGQKGNGVMPSNVNFTIQAAASSYGQLATTLVGIEWLCKKLNLWSRYVISLH